MLIITDQSFYTDIASAIRACNGRGRTYRPSQMAGAISALRSPWDVVATGASLSGMAYGTTSYIVSEAFANRSDVTAASFAYCKSVGASAFLNCSNLSQMSFPLLESISSMAFFSCGLTSVNLPACTYVDRAFGACGSLTDVVMPALTNVGEMAFNYCGNLTSVALGEVERVGVNAFFACNSLTYVSGITNVRTIELGAFGACYSLSSITLNRCESIGYNAFAMCSKLTTVDMTGATSVPEMGSDVFSRTPIAGYTEQTDGVKGYVYVPSSLYTDFITAPGWTDYATNIKSVREG